MWDGVSAPIGIGVSQGLCKPPEQWGNEVDQQ